MRSQIPAASERNDMGLITGDSIDLRDVYDPQPQLVYKIIDGKQVAFKVSDLSDEEKKEYGLR